MAVSCNPVLTIIYLANPLQRAGDDQSDLIIGPSLPPVGGLACVHNTFITINMGSQYDVEAENITAYNLDDALHNSNLHAGRPGRAIRLTSLVVVRVLSF
jgi:hypothetical protein